MQDEFDYMDDLMNLDDNGSEPEDETMGDSDMELLQEDDALYLDSDGDGITDTIGYDENQDGIADTFNMDLNGDGQVDSFSVDENGDGQIDGFGMDQNGDGMLDTFGADQNGDGQIDTMGFDTDGDGIIDTLQDENGNIEQIDGPYVDQPNEPYSPNQPDEPFNPYNPDQPHQSENPEPLYHDGQDIDNNGDITYMEVDTNSTHMEREAYFDSSQGLFYPPTFDPESGNDDVAGNPADDMEHWHMQTNPDTCAVVSQEFILEDLLGEEFNENDLKDLAEENGWYTPGGGTSMEDVGNILEHYGLNVERTEGSMQSLEEALNDGGKVIVGIDANEIWSNGDDAAADHSLEDMNGIPDADPNHAVEVIGIDRSDPDNPMVILNDPGHPGGQGAMIPLELFEDAWADSNNYMVTASK